MSPGYVVILLVSRWAADTYVILTPLPTLSLTHKLTCSSKATTSLCLCTLAKSRAVLPYCDQTGEHVWIRLAVQSVVEMLYLGCMHLCIRMFSDDYSQLRESHTPLLIVIGWLMHTQHFTTKIVTNPETSKQTNKQGDKQTNKNERKAEMPPPWLCP